MLMPALGGTARRIVAATCGPISVEGSPLLAWTPDGRQLLFTTLRRRAAVWSELRLAPVDARDRNGGGPGDRRTRRSTTTRRPPSRPTAAGLPSRATTVPGDSIGSCCNGWIPASCPWVLRRRCRTSSRTSITPCTGTRPATDSGSPTAAKSSSGRSTARRDLSTRSVRASRAPRCPSSRRQRARVQRSSRIALTTIYSLCPWTPSRTARSASPLRARQSTAVEYHPRISPDGRTLAFVSDRTGARDIWLANPDGTNPRQLTRAGPTHRRLPAVVTRQQEHRVSLFGSRRATHDLSSRRRIGGTTTTVRGLLPRRLVCGRPQPVRHGAGPRELRRTHRRPDRAIASAWSREKPRPSPPDGQFLLYLSIARARLLPVAA